MIGETAATAAAVEAVDNSQIGLVSYGRPHRARYGVYYFGGHFSPVCPQFRRRVETKFPGGVIHRTFPARALLSSPKRQTGVEKQAVKPGALQDKVPPGALS